MPTKRILLMDDDRDFAESIAMRCRSVGLEIETASNPLTAITIMGTHPPDLIILDVNMPTGDGLSVGEFLKKDSVAQGKPLIILTGSKDDAVRRRCEKLQAYYLHKSTDVWCRLRPVIEELLDMELAEPKKVSV